jgi:hypothetical protein
MTETTKSETEILDLSGLRRGDNVEVRRNGITHYFGQVDSVAPDLGVLWINEGVAGYRKMLETVDYTVWLVRRGG